MATANISIGLSNWTKLISEFDSDFLITWDVAKSVEFVVTELDQTPTIRGHRFTREQAITRETLGAGFVWAKLVSDGSLNNINLIVSKTQAQSGSSGGFDTVENVHKVSMYSWNTDTLSWERASSIGSSGSSGGASASMTKRFEVLPGVIYKGQAVLGTLESNTTWVITRIDFDPNGLPLSNKLSVGAWDNRGNLTYQ
jgi:hypothetical protein